MRLECISPVLMLAFASSRRVAMGFLLPVRVVGRFPAPFLRFAGSSGSPAAVPSNAGNEEILSDLRERMSAAGLDALVVPSDDPHLSECVLIFVLPI